MRPSFGLFGLAALGCHVASAARVELWWNITTATANPDGMYEREVLGVNGTWPPPDIYVSTNDTLVIHTHNGLDVPTALHAHGMFQNNTNYMDGPTWVTQCPIPAGYDFTYEFNITQHGTYWIHSHFKGQYMDGLRSALILKNPNEVYQYDEEFVVKMCDWYHASSNEGLAVFLNEDNPTGAEPVPQSGFMMDNANASLTFEPGKTYRLRLINVSGFSMMYFSIDGHDLDIIEVDGVDTVRQTVSSVYLAAAQRVSVLVTAKNTTDTNYYMHMDMDTDMFDTIPDDLVTNVTQILYYDKSHSNFAPSNDIGMDSDFDDIVLKSYVPEAAVEPDHRLNLTFNFDVMTDGINRGYFNDLPYLSPNIPTFNTMMSMGNLSTNYEVYGPQTRAYVLNHLDMVELQINNLDSGKHPFHLHGHVFQVIARGDGVYSEETNASSIQWYIDNPIRRDTVVVPAESFTIVRFRADNPGAWFFHCHVEWHLESGLAVTLIEAPDVAQQRMAFPQEMKDLCTAGGIPATGNGAGKEGLDLSGAPGPVTLIYDGFLPRGKGAMAACIIAALIGMGTIIWYALADPEKKAKEIRAAKQL